MEAHTQMIVERVPGIYLFGAVLLFLTYRRQPSSVDRQWMVVFLLAAGLVGLLQITPEWLFVTAPGYIGVLWVTEKLSRGIRPPK